MGQIGFSVTYKDEDNVKYALKQINKKRIHVKDVKVYSRNNQTDENFLKMINPGIFKIAFKNAVLGGCVGVTIFFLLWAITNNFIEGVTTFRMALLTLITGAAVGIFLGVAIFVISKEAQVPISMKDLEDESFVLDLKVDSALREEVEKILKRSGADNIFED